jgi:uncharacterized membrane protein YhhN
MKNILFTFLFLASIIGVFTGILLQVKWLDYIFKPLIMISIGGYFLLNSGKLNKSVVRFALIAFLFSLFGDSFLMFASDGNSYFIFGLASFLIAQIFYIFLFQKTIQLSGKEAFLYKKPIYIIPYFLYGVIVYLLLFVHLDFVLKIAVFVYITAILVMSAMALNRFKTVSLYSFYFVFAGSVLFIISDTLIALDKFLTPVPNDRIFVMSTYIAAQFLIMKGVLKQFNL